MSTLNHRTAPGSYKDRGAYLLHEFVIMPNHLHLLLTPAQATRLEKAVQLIKGGSSHQIHKRRGNKIEIWQQGFHDWAVRDFNDWQTRVEYIRLNPVRAKLVPKPEDWPYSSATGTFPLDSTPAKYLQLASAAKASAAPTSAPELKLRPPKEQRA
jgi:putative transposase